MTSFSYHSHPVFPQIHNGGRIFLYSEGATGGWVGAFKGGERRGGGVGRLGEGWGDRLEKISRF